MEIKSLGDSFMLRRLRDVGYDGLLVLQVARGVTGAEVQWVRSNRERVEGLWAEAA